MSAVLALIPKRYQHAAKAVVAAVGAVVGIVVTAIPDLPSWAAVVVALLTAAGVYQVPNVDQGEADEA